MAEFVRKRNNHFPKAKRVKIRGPVTAQVLDFNLPTER